MRDKSGAERTMTQFLWAGAVLLFILSEAQVIVSYLYAPTPHPSFGTIRLLATVLVVSVPGIAGLKGYSVAKGLPSAASAGEEARVAWLARNFLLIVIVAYVAIGWVSRQGVQ
jgi:hypothetical protein